MAKTIGIHFFGFEDIFRCYRDTKNWKSLLAVWTLNYFQKTIKNNSHAIFKNSEETDKTCLHKKVVKRLNNAGSLDLLTSSYIWCFNIIIKIRIIVLPLQWIYQRPLTQSLTAYLFPSWKLMVLPKAQWISFIHICMIDCNELGSVTTTRIGKQSNMVFLKDQYWDLSYSHLFCQRC